MRIRADVPSDVSEFMKYVTRLSKREEHILKMRFNLGCSRAKIAKEFDVSGERIRQIEYRALEKLRNYSSVKKFT